MKKEYLTPTIEIIEFDADVQMAMTLSGTGDNFGGSTDWE